jgi:hypothetical protein
MRPIPFLFFLPAAIVACSYSPETVFIHQNQAAAALATMAIEAELQGSSKLEMIYSAESELHENCAPLRDVASRRMRGESVSIDSELLAIFSLSGCERKMDQIEKFIWLEAPPVASFYLRPESRPKSVK